MRLAEQKHLDDGVAVFQVTQRPDAELLSLRRANSRSLEINFASVDAASPTSSCAYL